MGVRVTEVKEGENRFVTKVCRPAEIGTVPKRAHEGAIVGARAWSEQMGLLFHAQQSANRWPRFERYYLLITDSEAAVIASCDPI